MPAQEALKQQAIRPDASTFAACSTQKTGPGSEQDACSCESPVRLVLSCPLFTMLPVQKQYFGAAQLAAKDNHLWDALLRDAR